MQDTFELASILLPGAASYSLSRLARDLDIVAGRAPRPRRCRSRQLPLCRLLQEAASLPAGLVRTLLDCGQDSGWPPIRLLEDLEACGALFHDSRSAR